MNALIKKFVKEDLAQDLAEYGIALAIVATAAITAALLIKTDVTTLWNNAQIAIHSAAV